MSEPKILVLVLAIDKDPWKKIEFEGQIPTWMSQCPDNVEILRYTGQQPQNNFWKILNRTWIINQKILNHSHGRFGMNLISLVIRQFNFSSADYNLKEKAIKTNVPDLYSLIGKKTLVAFEKCVNEFDFDFIYRTNVSSYVDLRGLNEFIRDKPRSNYYAGTVGDHQGIRFASGCGYFISKDLVMKVLQNKELWDHNLIDDVSLGKLLTRNLHVKIEEVTRIDIDSVESTRAKIKERNVETFHYRCKAADPLTTIQIMTLAHKLI